MSGNTLATPENLEVGDYCDLGFNSDDRQDLPINRAIFAGTADKGGVWAIPLPEVGRIPSINQETSAFAKRSTMTLLKFTQSLPKYDIPSAATVDANGYGYVCAGNLKLNCAPGTCIISKPLRDVSQLAKKYLVQDVTAGCVVERNLLGPTVDEENDYVVVTNLQMPVSECQVPSKGCPAECPDSIDDGRTNFESVSFLVRYGNCKQVHVVFNAPVIQCSSPQGGAGDATNMAAVIPKVVAERIAKYANGVSIEVLVGPFPPAWRKESPNWEIRQFRIKNPPELLQSPKHVVVYGFRSGLSNISDSTLPFASHAFALTGGIAGKENEIEFAFQKADAGPNHDVTITWSSEGSLPEPRSSHKDQHVHKAAKDFLEQETKARLAEVNFSSSIESPASLADRDEKLESLRGFALVELDRQRKAFRLYYPRQEHQVEATAFGNVIAAVHSYAEETYGLDATLVLPRLQSILKDESLERLKKAEENVDLLQWSGIMTLLVGIAGSLMLCHHGPLWVPVVMFLSSVLLYYFVFYSATISAALSYSDQLKIAFDSQRGALMSVIGIAPPLDKDGKITVSAEKTAWKEIGKWWEYGDKDPTPYVLPGYTPGKTDESESKES